ncbi:Uncharacterized protein Rs2_29039 [Raphanus sativus]|nr:Uncharacterized protein Rs2_29039 [Raphanus sativus]
MRPPGPPIRNYYSVTKLRVSDLIDPVKKEWDPAKLRNHLHPNNIPLVRSLHLSRNPKPDGYCWNLSTSGKYSVKPDSETVFHGSWKNDSTTSGVGWILQLQDGSIDLLGLHGCHKLISPLHTELRSLVWALKGLSRHQRFYDYFVTDSQELVIMIANPEDWPAFAAELNEFHALWTSYQGGRVVYQPRSSNTQADFLARQSRARNRVFLYVNTSVPHWIDTRNSSFADSY